VYENNVARRGPLDFGNLCTEREAERVGCQSPVGHDRLDKCPESRCRIRRLKRSCRSARQATPRGASYLELRPRRGPRSRSLKYSVILSRSRSLLKERSVRVSTPEKEAHNHLNHLKSINVSGAYPFAGSPGSGNWGLVSRLSFEELIVCATNLLMSFTNSSKPLASVSPQNGGFR